MTSAFHFSRHTPLVQWYKLYYLELENIYYIMHLAEAAIVIVAKREPLVWARCFDAVNIPFLCIARGTIAVGQLTLVHKTLELATAQLHASSQ